MTRWTATAENFKLFQLLKMFFEERPISEQLKDPVYLPCFIFIMYCLFIFVYIKNVHQKTNPYQYQPNQTILYDYYSYSFPHTHSHI